MLVRPQKHVTHIWLEALSIYFQINETEILKAVLWTIELNRNLRREKKKRKKKKYFNEISLWCPNLFVQFIFPFPWQWYLCLCLCRRLTEEDKLYWCKPRLPRETQKTKHTCICWPNTPAVPINFEPHGFCLMSFLLELNETISSVPLNLN